MKLTAELINAQLIEDVLHVANNGIVLTDADGTIVWVNDFVCGLTGYCRDTLIGENPKLLKSGDMKESVYEEMWADISSGKCWKGKLINKCKDGSLYTERLTITPIFHDAGGMALLYPNNVMTAENHDIELSAGEIIGYIGVQQDITLEEDLRRRLSDSIKETRFLIKRNSELAGVSNES